ncbi:MAG: hypothetical protein HQ481_12255 [Alphaproteobacteria bacterium]|nr:hypothetical protein [Alphaproteobacteria bacterium]
MSKPNLPSRAKEPPDWSADAGGAAVWHARASQAFRDEQWEAAITRARRGQLVDPRESSLCVLEALACIRRLNADASLAARRVTVIAPDRAVGWRMLGALAYVTGRIDAARDGARRALALTPNDLAAARNYFQILKNDGVWDIAITYGRRTHALAPNDDDAAFDLGMLYLALGRWAEGWPLYDRRLALRDARPRADRFELPFWDGSLALELHLLVWTDQNIGDEMQFGRLLPEVTARVGKVTVECDPRLVPLFARSFPSITIVPRADPPAPVMDAGPYDIQIPQGHLGRLLRSDPAAFDRGPRRWLAAGAERASRLRDRYREWSGGRPVIGIAWKSVNVKFQGKNVPLPLWAPVMRATNALFLSVQYGSVCDDLSAARAATGVDIAHDPEIDPMVDLDGFAAQLEAVDAVISISNSTIHQACGLGRPVMGLLHVRPDWRWGLTGDTSPWFPSLRLYRQRDRGDWAPVLERVGADLRRWLAGDRGPW